ncbi:MAG: pyridoxamine 5'-phosphate oxidase family protein [Rhodospirillales bacterium]|nr:pyridoxamine 5'-phosphate oxidase family protein [Rhodospirillales bacterium]
MSGTTQSGFTLDTETRNLISRSVLCWLATSSSDAPSVSPKEMFGLSSDGDVLIANIASPRSRRNIEQNPNVCVSVLDIFSQKGAQIHGTANLHPENGQSYRELLPELVAAVGENIPLDLFRVRDIIQVRPTSVSKIIAPSYKRPQAAPRKPCGCSRTELTASGRTARGRNNRRSGHPASEPFPVARRRWIAAPAAPARNGGWDIIPRHCEARQRRGNPYHFMPQYASRRRRI